LIKFSDFKSLVGQYEKDSQGRPTWDLYFMTLALVVSQRSLDPRTKHGSVLISHDQKVLSLGYNGPLRGVDDTKVPLEAPGKYFSIIHAEENAILSFNGSDSDLLNSTIYVTGRPCYRCLRMIMQKGISQIVYGPIGSHCVDAEDIKAQEQLLSQHFIDLRYFANVGDLKSLIAQTGVYLEKKISEKI